MRGDDIDADLNAGSESEKKDGRSVDADILVIDPDRNKRTMMAISIQAEFYR